MRTYVPEGREAEALSQGPKWVVVDAAGQVLGRVATQVARVLIGKDKPNFTPYLDCGDHVVVINAQRIRLTGNKLEQKVYRCLLYTSPSPRDLSTSRMPSSA